MLWCCGIGGLRHNKWHSYILNGHFFCLDFSQPKDSTFLLELWEVHQQICKTLLEHTKEAPPLESLAALRTEVCACVSHALRGH